MFGFGFGHFKVENCLIRFIGVRKLCEMAFVALSPDKSPVQLIHAESMTS